MTTQPKFNKHPLTIAVVKSVSDNRITVDSVQNVTWGEFKQEYIHEHDIREEKDGIAIIPCGFLKHEDPNVELVEGVTDESGYPIVKRCSNNITNYTMLVIDIDDGPTKEEVLEFFGEYECVVTSTHNHMVDDLVKVRVFLPLKTPVSHDEIKKRKSKLLDFFPNPDSSTFSASRAFYLPSVPKERLQHAFIDEIHGNLFDVMEFSPDEPQPKPVAKDDRDNEPLTNYQKEFIKRELTKQGRVEHQVFYRLAAAMKNSGFTIHDFNEVGSHLKPNYETRAIEAQWWYSSKLDQIGTGTLIHILKDMGINVPRVRDKAKTALAKLNIKIEKAKERLKPYLGREDLNDDELEKKESLESHYNTLLDKKEALLKAENEANNQLNQLLDEREIYYVADVDKILEYKPDQGVWLDFKVAAFINRHPYLSGPGGKALLMTALSQRGGLRETVNISAKPQPEYVLNKFRKDHWVQPSKGEFHEIFDIFIRSLGDNKKENIDHIKQIVAWKYLHPEDYSLPCLVIFGEGGAGKTSFVTSLLGTIFGSHQVIALQQDQMKSFNGIIAGKMAVSIEESAWDKADKNHLKSIISQKTIMVNEKYGRQYNADNLTLYVIGGNGALGAVKLGRDRSDRRFSILKVSRSIIDHVMEVKSLDKDPAIEWWERNKKYLEDKEHCSRWLGSIIPLVEDLDSPPVALHGEDYQALLKAQSGPFEEIIDMVFDHPEFEFINGKEAFELYQLICDEHGYNKGGLKNTFNTRLADELKQTHPHIKYDSVKVFERNGVPTTNRGWVVSSLKQVNRKHYFVVDHPDIKHKRMINPQPFSGENQNHTPSHDDLMDE